jgi:hypothetical protein
MSINFSSFQSSKWSQRGQGERNRGARVRGGIIQILADQLTLFRGEVADYLPIDLTVLDF